MAAVGRDHGRREMHGRGAAGGMGAEKLMAAVGRGAWARGGAGASVRRESAWQRREN